MITEEKIQEIIPSVEEKLRQNNFIHRMAWANLFLSFIGVGLLIVIFTQVYVATSVKDINLELDKLQARLSAIEKVLVLTHKEIKEKENK